MSIDFEVTFTDRTADIIKAIEERGVVALNAVGIQAVSHAQANIRRAGIIDTGRLRNSITYTTKMVRGSTTNYKTNKQGEVIQDSSVQVQTMEKNTVVIGTAVSYGVWHEVGTGIYASDGTGRKTPWSYYDSEGVQHWTRGVRATHYLRNAIADNKEEYRQIILRYLKG